jgi:hypothetical protein
MYKILSQGYATKAFYSALSLLPSAFGWMFKKLIDADKRASSKIHLDQESTFL